MHDSQKQNGPTYLRDAFHAQYQSQAITERQEQQGQIVHPAIWDYQQVDDDGR
jgi:hypothetical protein